MNKFPRRANQPQNIILVLLIVVLVLTGCDSEEPVAVIEENVVEVESTPMDAPVVEETAAAAAEGVTDVQMEETAVAEEPIDECLACHTDREMLIATAAPVEEVVGESEGNGRNGEVVPLESWEKVLVDNVTYPKTVHGQIPCQDCHSGAQSPDKAAAHEGLVKDPSADPATACGECHPDIIAMNQYSLHSNLTGFQTVLFERSAQANHVTLMQALDNNCSSCHTTCADCHISQPELAGGGLISGHNFNAEPSMTSSCTACHDSTIGKEFLGKHEGLAGDVHFEQGGMTCLDCHTGHEMHGQPADCQRCHEGPEPAGVAPADHRYADVQSPRCETCHLPAAMARDDNVMHQQHGGDLSCQVCHSVPYTSCDGCHVAISETTGNPIYALDSSYLSFKIGLNPLKSYDRPYEYVTLRHVPVTTDSFAFYGDNLLSNYSALPTWAYTTPHNIQRQTPQTESCTSCHGQPELFLTVDDLTPEELEANLSVIVESVPRPVTEILASPRITVTQPVTTTGE